MQRSTALRDILLYGLIASNLNAQSLSHSFRLAGSDDAQQSFRRLDVNDDVIIGEALTAHDLPRNTPLQLSGVIKEDGGRRWIELRCNFSPRNVRRPKRSQMIEETTNGRRFD